MAEGDAQGGKVVENRPHLDEAVARELLERYLSGRIYALTLYHDGSISVPGPGGVEGKDYLKSVGWVRQEPPKEDPAKDDKGSLTDMGVEYGLKEGPTSGETLGTFKFVKLKVENLPTFEPASQKTIDLGGGMSYTVTHFVGPSKESVMKPKKLEALFKFYLKKLMDGGYRSGKEEIPSVKDQLNYVCSLCEEGVEAVAEGDKDKAMKLLGWIQGVLNFTQKFTRKELEQHLAPRDPRQVTIDYTNWKGERRVREVIPVSVLYTSNEWHKEPQWLLFAYDVEDGHKEKSFALKNIHSWTPHPED